MDLLVGLFSALVALCHWRLVVCLAVGLLAAVVLAQQIFWFTGGMGLWMVLLALGIGCCGMAMLLQAPHLLRFLRLPLPGSAPEGNASQGLSRRWGCA